VIAGQQVGVLGPAFALFRGPVGGTADLEVGFPVERAPRPEGDVRASALPGGRVARMTHRGSFDGLGASWDRLQRWLREQGLSPSAQRWESYVTEPTPRTWTRGTCAPNSTGGWRSRSTGMSCARPVESTWLQHPRGDMST
jgi:GyrI-like small molecule binding domain